jgi:hypothetical protein
MVSYKHVGLKPTWKNNLCFLIFVATIASASIFALQYKMMTPKLLTLVVGDSRAYDHAMRRFRPPWSVEDLASCFVVKDQGGQELAFIYYEDDPNKRSILKLLSRDEAQRIAAAITKLPEDRGQIDGTECPRVAP